MHSFIGPLVGSIIYVLMQTFLTGFTEYWALFLGAAIILLVMLMPNGIMGLLWELRRSRRNRAHAKSACGDWHEP
jgi:branched-chain amino acid transport system permease protein